MSAHFDSEKIENKQWQEDKLTNHEFEYCTFAHCNFSKASILSSSFVDCDFHDCNLALTNLGNTILNGAKFYNCKVLGVKFNYCNDFIFDVYFEDSVLDYCSFEGLKMSKIIFKNCSLKGVDFINSQLKQAKFINCNLDEAAFSGTNLQESDFTSSYNYAINLQENFVKKTRFGKDGLAGLLRNYDIIIEEA